MRYIPATREFAMGTLYLVSTPIGNMEDITLRALRMLREASLIAAEDTRHTQRLLARYTIDTPCLSYHEHNKLSRLDEVLTTLANGDVALVSDAGTPGMSDPVIRRPRAFWVLLPLQAVYAAVSIPICMLLSLGDLQEEPNNHLVVARKPGV